MKTWSELVCRPNNTQAKTHLGHLCRLKVLKPRHLIKVN